MRARSRIRMSFHATELQAVRTLIFVKCNLPYIVSFLIILDYDYFVKHKYNGFVSCITFQISLKVLTFQI